MDSVPIRNGNSPMKSEHARSFEAWYIADKTCSRPVDSSNGHAQRSARTTCVPSIGNRTHPYKYACKPSVVPAVDGATSKSSFYDSAKPPSKGKDGVIQLLDYNLARFDFQDLKGISCISSFRRICSMLNSIYWLQVSN